MFLSTLYTRKRIRRDVDLDFKDGEEVSSLLLTTPSQLSETVSRE